MTTLPVRRLGRIEWAAGALLATGYLAVLLATVPGVGFVRDEGYYFRAASDYLGWFEGLWARPGEALRDDVIVRQWGYNREHPALMKTLFAFSWKVFHQKLGWVGHSTGYRLPGMALSALMVFLTWLFAAQAYGRGVAFAAALLLATIPRLFHDAHLACFDVGITALHVLVVYAWWRSLDSRRWAVATGLAFGLALATKLNAFFLPLVLLAHALVRGRGLLGEAPPGEADRLALRIPPIPAALAAMLLLGPLVFFAHWPLLWHHPLERAGWYLRFHLSHEHYPIEYLGKVLDFPPFPAGTWAFPLVMTWVTVPLATVLLMTLGFGRAAWRELALVSSRPLASDEEMADRRRTRLLLILGGFYPIFLMALPGVPIFGGVKHWFPAMPFLAILAALELDRLIRRLVAPERRHAPFGRATFAAAVAAAVVTGVLGIRLVHPYGIGFYNELIGSVRGGAEHGMMRNFWGYTSRGNLDYLNRHVEPGGRVFFQRTNHDCYLAYQREGLLRPDIRYASSLDDADWATIHVQRTFDDDEYRIWNSWGTSRPETGVYVDEVPMNLVYRRAGGPR